MSVDQFEVFRYPNRSVTAAQRSQTSRFSVGFSGRNSEQTCKQPKPVVDCRCLISCLGCSQDLEMPLVDCRSLINCFGRRQDLEMPVVDCRRLINCFGRCQDLEMPVVDCRSLINCFGGRQDLEMPVADRRCLINSFFGIKPLMYFIDIPFGSLSYSFRSCIYGIQMEHECHYFNLYKHQTRTGIYKTSNFNMKVSAGEGV